ncbi:MAG: DUF429 domain-containing protein, partial [Methanobacteriota archaeon]
MTVVVGVDGARAGSVSGWVAVRLEGGRLGGFFRSDFAGVLAESHGAAVIAVDIPVGHEGPGASGGRRACDVSAQAFLGPRRSSVFLVPPPATLSAPTFEEALARTPEGYLKPSRQLWNIRDRITGVEAAARTAARSREVHPEVSFVALARALGQAPPAHAKTTWEGLAERLDLLAAADLRPTRSVGGVGKVGADDVLDATVCAWSAGRIAAGTAETLPAEPPTDPATGRPVRG